MTDIAQVKQQFLDFFAQQDHTIIPSASLIPQHDPSLLFVNAGMVPFKPYFLGDKQPAHANVCSIQRCLRVGGKHNDLDAIGFTERHHTHFSMMGNFSFGGYFKDRAISMAWECLTQVFNIDPKRLWVSVHQDDQQSADIWLKTIGLAKDRLSFCGDQDNFWSMGDTGPCGPCTEIFYDFGPDLPGGPPGHPDQDGPRYMEIWNLVFMQYVRDQQGQLGDLPQKCVDTGMGLERLMAVMAGCHDTYQLPVYTELMQQIQALAKVPLREVTKRVVADHCRSIMLMLGDGVSFAAESQGYILRRLVRRATVFLYQDQVRHPMLHQLVPIVLKTIDYPASGLSADQISQVIEAEQAQFFKILQNGISRLEEALRGSSITGQELFQLYDTYGMPKDLMIDMAKSQGVSCDIAGFEAALAEQKNRSKRVTKSQPVSIHGQFSPTEFLGYQYQQLKATCIGLLSGDQTVKRLEASGQLVHVALDQTPFYPEGGGQVGDGGIIETGSATFEVTDTQKKQQVIWHQGYLRKGTLEQGETVQATVNPQRAQIAANHSATHLLHAALRQHIGKQVSQKGSYVGPEYLRFDFAYSKALTADEIMHIEQTVNQWIERRTKANISYMSMQAAIKQGAAMLESAQYDAEVRVVDLGSGAIELCGGCHVSDTSEIGQFKITDQSAVGQGVRRIEAVTGRIAWQWLSKWSDIGQSVAQLLGETEQTCLSALNANLAQQQADQQKIEQLIQRNCDLWVHTIQDQIIHHQGLRIFIKRLSDQDTRKEISQYMDACFRHDQVDIGLLMGGQAERAPFVIKVKKTDGDWLSAKKLMQWLAAHFQAKGGGQVLFASGLLMKKVDIKLLQSKLVELLDDMSD
ncbi:alanine--tRNA ligase [Gammaproteobacteria bacterium]|nr:alanine--tRNA ligase [Gammaproteobacteria bacterium]